MASKGYSEIEGDTQKWVVRVTARSGVSNEDK